MHNSSCLNPGKIVWDKENCISQMKSTINAFHENGWIPEDDYEAILLDYQDFLETNLSVFSSFGELKDRLIDFFSYDHMRVKRIC